MSNLASNSGWHDPAWRRFVGRWALVSGILIAIVCHFSYDFFQFDEYYQVTEFVSYKLGKTPAEALAWEYNAQIRPWLQPAVYYLIGRGLEHLGVENPFILAEAFRIASGLVAWAAIVSLMLASRVFFEDEQRRRLAVIVLATLFILPYLAARTSSEAVSGSLFSLGFATLILGSAWSRRVPLASAVCQCPRDEHGQTSLARGAHRGIVGAFLASHPRLRFGLVNIAGFKNADQVFVPKTAAVVAGLFFGLAFDCRYQIAFAVLGIVAWIYCFSAEKRWPTIGKLALLSCGVMLAVGLGTAVDCWGYGHFVVAPWNYFYSNLVLNIAERYGKSPAWWYLFGANSGPMIGVTLVWTIGLVAAWLRYPKHPITWATLGFCLVHSLVGHKEVRFLFPMAQLAAIALVLGIAPGAAGWEQPRGLLSRLRRPKLARWLWERRQTRWAKGLYAWNFMGLAMMGLTTRQPSILLQKMIYDRFPHNCYAYDLGKESRSLYSNVGVEMYFYRPPGFHLTRLDGYDELDVLMQHPPAKFLLITDHIRKAPEQDLVVPGAKLIYRNYPEWVADYNYDNWLERSRCYSLYEVEATTRETASAAARQSAKSGEFAFTKSP